MLFPPLPYVSLLLLAIGAAAIPPERVYKLSDLVSTHHHAGGQPPHQPPTTTIRDAQGQAEQGQSSNVHAPHRVAAHDSTETHKPDDAPTSSASRYAITKAKKEALGFRRIDKLPIHLQKFSQKQIEKGRFAHEGAYHRSEQERKRMSSQAKTPEEHRKLLIRYNNRKSREKKALFGFLSADLMPKELKGLPLEEARARLIETFEGRANGLFSPELLARAASAMKHSSATQHSETVRKQGTAAAYTLGRVPRGGNANGQVMRSHHTEPTARPAHVLPQQTSSDGAPVWREVQQQAHEGSSSGHGNVYATQAAPPASPFLFDFEWPPTP